MKILNKILKLTLCFLKSQFTETPGPQSAVNENTHAQTGPAWINGEVTE